MYNLGFSTGVFYPEKNNLTEALEDLLSFDTNLVEVNFATPSELFSFSDKDLELVKQFKTVTIHAPFKDIKYKQKDVKVLNKLKELADIINPKYILFHPDTVTDFEFLYSKLGKYIAFENMDVRKTFGNKVIDLKKVFEKCPDAGWVCDLNHVYTIDKTMKFARELHKEFSSRLVGYHISGYDNDQVLHTCFYRTNEIEILSAIEDFSVTLVHEGGCPLEENFLNKEWKFVNKYLEDSAIKP